MAEQRTIPRLWRDAVATQHAGAAYLVAARRPLARGDVGRRGRARRAPRERPPRPRACARATRSRSSRGTTLEWALFDFALAHVGAIGAADLRERSPHDVAVRARALGGGRRPLRGRGAARRRSRPSRAGLPDAPARAHVRRPRRARGGGARVPAGTSRRPRRGRRGDRRGGPLHVHLHVGDDRAAQGLHDPAPQLLRDGRRHPTSSPTTARDERRDAALPAARPQLRAADASLRPVRRLHDRLPPRPARRRATRCPRCGRRSSRACRASTRRSTRRSSSSFAEATGVRRRLVDWALRVGYRESALRQQGRPMPASLAVQHRLADRLVFSKVRERLGGRLRTADLGRRAAREGDRGVLRRARHLHPRGIRPDRVHDGGDDEHGSTTTGSGRWGSRFRASSSRSPRTESC